LDEVPIHYIQVEHVGSAPLYLGDLLAQAGEIRSQN
jgi:hypothetical protein